MVLRETDFETRSPIRADGAAPHSTRSAARAKRPSPGRRADGGFLPLPSLRPDVIRRRSLILRRRSRRAAGVSRRMRLRSAGSRRPLARESHVRRREQGRKPVDARNTRRRSAGRGLAAGGPGRGLSRGGRLRHVLGRRDAPRLQHEPCFSHPDPLVVLRDSQDADDRARALRALREPLQYGGDQHDQDVVVTVLTTAADERPPDRLPAWRPSPSLRHFKDPRAIEGLKEAYYRAGSFNPETATILRCQAHRRPGGDGPAGRGGAAGQGGEGAAGGRGDGRQAGRRWTSASRPPAPSATSRNTRPRKPWPTCCGPTRTWPCATGPRNRCAPSPARTCRPDYQAWADFLNKPEGHDAVVKENSGSWIKLAGWWGK